MSIKIMLAGYNGRMGNAVIDAVNNSREFEFEIVAGIDINHSQINIKQKFPQYFKPDDYSGEVDVILDFSHHSSIESLLSYALARKVPLVIATTGHNQEELNLIEDYAKKIAIFKSANMSIGVNLLIELAKKASVLLKDNFDIEIIEKHHNQKLDAPSGTALMIADGISEVFENNNKPEYVNGRQNKNKKRGKNEIGIHAVRGGTIIGEHEVIFAGTNELISITHSAQSREMFANGALSAAKFMCGKNSGLYNMKDLINL